MLPVKMQAKLNDDAIRAAMQSDYTPRTEHGRCLLALRQQALQQGVQTLTDDEVRALSRGRGGTRCISNWKLNAI